ncbi:MAG: hypothetical protein K2X93_13705 [Candidatus Obscuribacterales bacterium]|nr:hypothetical protein [Candidatus Obscuribacterales bacterium]
MNHEYHNQFEQPAPVSFANDSNPLCLLSLYEEQQANGTPNLETRVGNLLRRLDSAIFVEREMADRDLRRLGRFALPLFEAELRNPRSVEVQRRLQNIYRSVSGADDVTFSGSAGRDGVNRLREITGLMSITYREGAVPNKGDQVDSIRYERAGGWFIQRQGDGTYTITQDNNDGQAMESGVRISVNQRNGNVRAVLSDGTAMVIPPYGPRWWYREGSEPPFKPKESR